MLFLLVLSYTIYSLYGIGRPSVLVILSRPLVFARWGMRSDRGERTKRGAWKEGIVLLDGYTLTHEHMSIDLTPGDLGTDSFYKLCDDLREIRRFGVRNIVDLTNQTMGRDVAYIQRLADATGINIIMSTGFYLDRYSKWAIEGKTIDELAGEMLRDLQEGIDGTGIPAGIIGEVAWSAPEPTECELMIWEAVALVSRETNSIVSTHPSYGVQQVPQARFLIERGVAPERIVIGHVEFYPSDNALQELFDLGVFIGVDMIGKSVGEGDEYRADLVAKAKRWGYLDQVLLSCDLCRRQDLKSCGGYGYAHFFETFVPLLKRRGIVDADINLMLGDNPHRLFCGSA